MAEWLACRAFLLITVKRRDGRRVGSNPARVQVLGGFIPQRVSLDEKTSLIWLQNSKLKSPDVSTSISNALLYMPLINNSKLLTRVQLGFVNISIERNNITTKYVLRWSTTPSRYFTDIWNKIWTN